MKNLVLLKSVPTRWGLLIDINKSQLIISKVLETSDTATVGVKQINSIQFLQNQQVAGLIALRN